MILNIKGVTLLFFQVLRLSNFSVMTTIPLLMLRLIGMTAQKLGTK
jgi:hypothetical protein